MMMTMMKKIGVVLSVWSSFFPSAPHSESGASAADQLDSISNQMSYISPAPPKTAPLRYHLRRFTFFHPYVHCAYFTAVVMHGILVILPPADAIYLIITIHKSHPQSQHPLRGTHTLRKV